MQWFLYVNAALTFFIAIFMGYIAYQQFQVNRRREKHELYEKRIPVFRATMTFISMMIGSGKIDWDSLLQFYRDTSEADFLFGDEIRAHIDKLYDLGNELICLSHSYPDDGRPRAANEEIGEIRKRFSEELISTKELFAKYLKIK